MNAARDAIRVAREAAPAVLGIGAMAAGVALGWHPIAIAGLGAAALINFLYLATRHREAHERDLERVDLALVELGAVPGPGSSLEKLGDAARDARQRLVALERAASDLDAVLDAADVGILAADPDGRVVQINREAAAMLRVRPERVLGRAIEDMFVQGEIVAAIRQARAGRRVQGQARAATGEGFRTWEFAAGPAPMSGAKAGDATGLVLTLRNVTDQARALQVRTDFVANASHELRTPIASMRLALETLDSLDPDSPADHASRERLMAVLSANIARLEEMVRDLLDLSRLESPEARIELVRVPASTLRAQLEPVYEAVCADRKLSLVFDLDPRLEGLITDRSILALILGNLIDNATKYAYEGTTIRVTGRAAEPPPGTTSSRLGARFEVADQGVGIPLDQQGRVFERYYQVDPSRSGMAARRGTGLGLAIVKHAVKRLGGAIRVQSVWKEGTTMVVELPACVELPAADPPVTTAPAPSPPRGAA